MIGVALTFLSVGAKLYGAYSDREDSERQARLQELASKETLRRMDYNQYQRMGTIASRAGASGFDLDSVSYQAFIEGAKEEYGKERLYTEQTGIETAKSIRKAGRDAFTSGVIGAGTTAIGGAMKYGSEFGSLGSPATEQYDQAGIKAGYDSNRQDMFSPYSSWSSK